MKNVLVLAAAVSELIGPLRMIFGQVLGAVSIQLAFLVKVLAISMHGRPVIAQNKYGQYAPFGRRTALPRVRCRRRYCAAFSNITCA
jgi:hypothetical protein